MGFVCDLVNETAIQFINLKTVCIHNIHLAKLHEIDELPVDE